MIQQFFCFFYIYYFYIERLYSKHISQTNCDIIIIVSEVDDNFYVSDLDRVLIAYNYKLNTLVK